MMINIQGTENSNFSPLHRGVYVQVPSSVHCVAYSTLVSPGQVNRILRPISLESIVKLSPDSLRQTYYMNQIIFEITKS